MKDPRYPTGPYEMYDPVEHPPPRGEVLLVATEGFTTIKSPWFEGAIAWAYLPGIPKSVKERQWQLTQQKQQSELEDERRYEAGAAHAAVQSPDQGASNPVEVPL